jgi:hypothetical protein
MMWGHPGKEPLMRRALTIAGIAVVVLVAIVKLAVAPVKVAAGTDTSGQATISTYDLDTRYPGINRLPVEEAPQP